jgi:hypothetical protein
VWIGVTQPFPFPHRGRRLLAARVIKKKGFPRYDQPERRCIHACVASVRPAIPVRAICVDQRT